MDTQDISDFFDTSKASCKGKDITLFYPNLPAGQHRKDVELAKEVCKECEVVEGCLDYSLRYEPLGVWGGKSEIEREILRRQRKITLPLDRRASPTVRRSVNAGRVQRIINRLDLANE